MGLIGKVIKPVAGLAFEANASRKARSKSTSPLPTPHQEDTQHGSVSIIPSSPPPSYTNAVNSPSASENFDLETDEREWQLDDAAEVVVEETSTQPSVPKGNMAGPATVVHLATAFTTAHPPGDSTTRAKLELPIIIPQRRPHNRHRGFIRAYAPLLEECGIMDQATWIEFLDSFDEAIKVTPVFNVVNYAAQIAGLMGQIVPSPTAAAVSTAITVADLIAKEAYERHRVNSFLAEMNTRYFRPQGLYCLIMSYKPSSSSLVSTFDLTSTIIKAIDPPEESGWKQKLKTFSKSSATTHGEVEMPLAAPLIYPALDQASDKQKEGFFARKKEFVVDYLDRRAQATFASENPSSSLSTNPQFASRYGDPSAFDRFSLGSLLGASRSSIGGQRGGSSEALGRRGSGEPTTITTVGGRESFDGGSRIGQRMGMRRERSRGGLVGGLVGAVVKGVSSRGQSRGINEGEGREQSGRTVRLGRGRGSGRPSQGFVKKLLTPDVIYLMVVALPPEEELEAARRLLEAEIARDQ